MSRGVGLVGVPVSRDGITLPAQGVQVSSSAAAGVAVTVGVSNTPGAWTELIASTAAVGSFLTVSITTAFVAGTALPMLLDISVGAAAAEVAVIPSIAMGQATRMSFVFPIHIPTASRIACRITSSAATVSTAPTIRCEVDTMSRRSTGKVAPSVVAVGANVGASTGVAISSNATWVEITSATAQPFQALLMSYTGNDATTPGGSETLSLGLGASGSEETIDTMTLTHGTSEQITYESSFLPVARHVPAGSRVAMKHSLGATNVGAGVVLGIPYA